MTRQTKIALVRQDILQLCADELRAWAYGDDINGAKLRAKVDAILCRLVKEEHGCVTDNSDAARAVARLLAVRDALELAARPPGDLITITRQEVEAILDDIGVVACAIRGMSERVS